MAANDAKFLSLWQEVVVQVQAMAAGPSRRTQANFTRFDTDLLVARMKPAGMAGGVLPPATPQAWQKLVHDMKVPMRLGKACCQLLDTTWPQAVYVAMRAWMYLLHAASDARLLANDDFTAIRPMSSIAAAIGQQLQQSGLLQRLPAVATATARRLQAAAGVGAAAAGEPGLTITEAEAEQLELTVQTVNFVLVRVPFCYFTADYYRDHSPALIAPLGHLAVASLQYLSVATACGAEPTALCAPMHDACIAAHNCLLGAVKGVEFQAPEVSEWLRPQPGKHNYLLQCACLANTLAAIRVALQAQLTAPPPDTAALLANDTEVYTLAFSLADTVPDACSSMLQLLGISNAVALWAAARADTAGPVSRSMFMAHATLHFACTAQLQEPSSEQTWDRQAVAEALPLLWQLPAVALLWACKHELVLDGQMQDIQYVLACHSTVPVTAEIILDSLRLQRFLDGCLVSPGELQLRSEGSSQAGLPRVFLEVAQPRLCEVLQELLNMQRISVAHHANGGSSSGSTGGSALPPAIPCMPWVPAAAPQNSISGATCPKLPLTTVVDAAGSLLYLMAQHTMRPAIAAAAAAALQCAAARKLCTRFEDLLRGQTEALMTPGWAAAAGQVCVAALLGMRGLLSADAGGWQTGPLVDPIFEPAAAAAVPTGLDTSELPAVPCGELYGLLSSVMKVAGNSTIMQLLDTARARGEAGQGSGLPAGDRPAAALSTALQYVESVCRVVRRQLEVVLFTHRPASGDRLTAIAMLPVLALQGCGSILYSSELQSRLSAAETASGAAAAGSSSTAARSRLWSDYMRFVGQTAACVQEFLQLGNAAAHISSAGYDLQPLLQQLARVTAALQAADSTQGAAQGSATSQELIVRMQVTAFGYLLASLAHPCACNNPHCRNLSGDHEILLVIEGATKCGGCKTARYCGRECLKQHWPHHKPVCKALKAAAATTVAAGSGSTSS